MFMVRSKYKIIRVLVLFMALASILNYCPKAYAASQLSTTYDQTKWIPSLGNGHEVVDLFARYSEYYTTNQTAKVNTFNKHAIYWYVTLTNNSPDISTDLYMFPTSTHYSSTGKEYKKFSLNTSEAAYFPGDITAYGNKTNSESVTYTLTTTCYAEVGFMINVNGAIPWSDTMRLQLNSESRGKAMEVVSNAILEENNKEINFYRLGEIERQYLGTTYEEENELAILNHEKLVAELMVYGYSEVEATELAKGYIAKRTEAYKNAINKGIWVSDEEVTEKIQLLRNAISSVDNYEEYLEFIAGTGMTEDEYWNTQTEIYRINEIITRGMK